MKTSFPSTHRPGSRRFGQSAPATLCPVAAADRTARAAERPRIALDTGHGAGSECGAHTVIAACDQLALEGYLRHTARRPSVVMDLPTPQWRRNMYRSRTPIRYRGADRRCCPTYHHGRPGMLAFHPGMPDPIIFRSILVEIAQPSRQIRTYRSFGPITSRLSAALRGDSALSHASRGVKCTASRSSSPWCAVRLSTSWARLLIDDGDQVWMEEPGITAPGRPLSRPGRSWHVARQQRSWTLIRRLSSPHDLRDALLPSPSRHNHADEQRLNLLHMAETWPLLDHRGRL